MNRLFSSLVCLLACVSVALAAAPTTRTVDGNWFTGGLAISVYSSAKGDTIKGAAGSYASRTIISKISPTPGWEYILCRDTMSQLGSTTTRDADTIQVDIEAYGPNDEKIGVLHADTMYVGSQPEQIVLPFAQTIIGSYYKVKLNACKATDSIYVNKLSVYKRKCSMSSGGGFGF